MTDDDGLEPTEEEVKAERRRIATRTKEATDRLAARHFKAGDPATAADLFDVLAVAMGYATAFAIKHVKLRAVLRDDLPGATRDVLAKWSGVWTEGRAYSQGALVACAHGLWIAERATTAKPGTPDSGWRLALKGPR